MATGFKNNRSTTKGIRFPHDLIEEINISVEREKADNPGANFSSWVLDACGRKLKAGQRKNAKEYPKD
ncbi:YlcI/YnfO family protein [Erwinia sp. V90_4]|uniref:YlcI/YnfO family protein n=1 Tax=Erwinia sp. V90_4 TaxID=3044239 RepID=UPI00249E44D3|nr:YlcI/YnfO family protein [Erwinia sp. V90_4]MDI3441648.1 YlcI/YnfO family protein [Erwinia sp. V90_4]